MVEFVNIKKFILDECEKLLLVNRFVKIGCVF